MFTKKGTSRDSTVESSRQWFTLEAALLLCQSRGGEPKQTLIGISNKLRPSDLLNKGVTLLTQALQ